MSKQVKSIAIPDEVVMSKIFVVRGIKVMFDRDLAALYGVETRVLLTHVASAICRMLNFNSWLSRNISLIFSTLVFFLGIYYPPVGYGFYQQM